MANFEVRFSPLPAHVRTARLIATALARRSGVDEETVDEVRLAVGEACSRAVELHQQHCPDVAVSVTMSDDDRHFEVQVRDFAPPEAEAAGDPIGVEAADQEAVLTALADTALSPAPAPPASASSSTAPPPGSLPVPAGSAREWLPPGVGLAVISGLVDEVDVASTAHGATVRMRWPANGTTGTGDS
ncbi:MAG: ATP-binding protein [Actinomycetota bacterium]|jgi:anti-sigma regulatory factor (Ser/Thr protein kinase)|nr:ATP-binding protein [Acidothermales bacterium]MDQ3432961.1 ATP-binding protein [Actinomycetota bacterium]